MTSSRVRVAVRVRPLGHQEVAQGGTHVVSARHPEIHLGERRFTFDSVFDTSVSQAALFDEVSGPLQTSFLDGYNATVSLLSNVRQPVSIYPILPANSRIECLRLWRMDKLVQGKLSLWEVKLTRR